MLISAVAKADSPPHRWLRNIMKVNPQVGDHSPPHRWLRKLQV
ncbi:hypothetical protein [uncultured Gammaproteobacteria bacterium]|nr:hypothetical protein [uncultured Gammaproteobacteria bacterium]VVH59455.1 hypothetical protein BAZOLSSOX_323 [uncultured Gammaproteobacteria bacterium]